MPAGINTDDTAVGQQESGDKKTKRRPGRQQDILDVFTDLVASRGYDETSISEIAGALGISKGTIMHHYGSKERILEAMSLRYMNQRLLELDVILEEYERAPQRLAAVILTIVTGLRDDYAATRAFSREFMRFVDDPVMDEVRRLRAKFTSTVRSIIVQGVEEGSLQSRSPKILTLQILGMCNWNWTWLHPLGPLDAEEIARLYIEHLMYGLTTRDQPDDVLPSELHPRIAALRKARQE
jgi:AcrR family transcriptional regulator